MQGGVDHEGNVNARYNNGWSDHQVTKVQAQVCIQALACFFFSRCAD